MPRRFQPAPYRPSRTNAGAPARGMTRVPRQSCDTSRARLQVLSWNELTWVLHRRRHPARALQPHARPGRGRPHGFQNPVVLREDRLSYWRGAGSSCLHRLANARVLTKRLNTEPSFPRVSSSKFATQVEPVRGAPRERLSHSGTAQRRRVSGSSPPAPRVPVFRPAFTNNRASSEGTNCDLHRVRSFAPHLFPQRRAHAIPARLTATLALGRCCWLRPTHRVFDGRDGTNDNWLATWSVSSIRCSSRSSG